MKPWTCRPGAARQNEGVCVCAKEKFEKNMSSTVYNNIIVRLLHILCGNSDFLLGPPPRLTNARRTVYAILMHWCVVGPLWYNLLQQTLAHNIIICTAQYFVCTWHNDMPRIIHAISRYYYYYYYHRKSWIRKQFEPLPPPPMSLNVHFWLNPNRTRQPLY